MSAAPSEVDDPSKEKAQPFGLHSPDGQNWANAITDPADPNWRSRVERLVIGGWKGDGENFKRVPLNAGLIQDWAVQFPKLQCIHLWNLTGVTELPALPSKLHTLEVRNCPDLTGLPQLPETLEVLDVAGCSGLTVLRFDDQPVGARLSQIFLDECAALGSSEIVSLIRDVTKGTGARLLEFRAAKIGAVTAEVVAELIGKGRNPGCSATLVKLVLSQCENLKEVGNLKAFAELRHLDLSGCKNLKSIEDLPSQLQYFVVSGPGKLDFAGQEVPAYDLSADAKQNVARRFRTRRKFGGQLALGAHAKVLFLGDGRAGKTTLATELRRYFSRPGTDVAMLPRPDEIATTHGIQLGSWQTHVVLPDQDRTALAAREQDHDWSASWHNESAGELKADLQIWDVGGQEIYHQTHRAFAAVGTVYVLVWRPNWTEEDLEKDFIAQERLAKEQQLDWQWSKQEWMLQNRRHPLRYWIDYLTTLPTLANQEKLRNLLVVCPWVSSSKRERPNLREAVDDPQLLKLIDQNQFFVFNPREGNPHADQEFQRFARRLQELGGQVASELGLLQPQVYEQAVMHVDNTLGQIHREEQSGRDSIDLDSLRVQDWEAWKKHLVPSVKTASPEPLNDDDVESITSYLDASGRLMIVRDGTRVADRSTIGRQNTRDRWHLVVDKVWILKSVYTLLNRNAHSGGVYARIAKGRGRICLRDLKANSFFRGIDSEAGALPLLDFMQETGLLVHLGGEGDEAEYLVPEQTMLPIWGTMQAECAAVVKKLGEGPGQSGWEFDFPNSRLCEFDVRPILGHLGRTFGQSSVFFRDGMQVAGQWEPRWDGDRPWDDRLWYGFRPHDASRVPGEPTQWVLRVRWEPNAEDSMLGILRGGLLARGPDAEKLQQKIAELLSDLPGVGGVNKTQVSIPGVFAEYVGPVYVPQAATRQREQSPNLPMPKVFISYSQDNDEHKARVKALADWLRTQGIEAWIDQYVTDPSEGWPKWMQNQVTTSEFVIVVVTERYASKADERSRSGVRFESVLLTQYLYNTGMVNERFIPVLFDKQDVGHIPFVLTPYSYYLLEAGKKEDYERLRDKLHGVLPTAPPVIPRPVPPSPPSTPDPKPWER